MQNTFYTTDLGSLFLGKSEDIIKNELIANYKNKCNLIITSPPFPLNAKKKYGNLQGEEYKEWFSDFALLSGTKNVSESKS